MWQAMEVQKLRGQSMIHVAKAVPAVFSLDFFGGGQFCGKLFLGVGRLEDLRCTSFFSFCFGATFGVLDSRTPK